MTDEDDDRPVGFMDRNGMTQPVMVGTACRHGLCPAICARTQRCREANERAVKPQGSEAIGRCSMCRHPVLLPHWPGRSVSVSDKAIGAPVASNRLAAAGNAINPINSAQQCRLGI